MSEKTKSTTPANIFAIVGFALLFIVAIWSGIQVVKYAPRALSGLSMFEQEPSITMDASKANVQNGEEFELSWKLTGNVDGGAVSFLYKCNDGLSAKVYDDLTKAYKVLPCSSPYNMPVNTRKLKIKMYTNKTMQDAALAIVYTNAAGEKYKDIKKITIANKNAQEESLEQELLDNASSTLSNLNQGKEGVTTNNTTEANNESDSNTSSDTSANNTNGQTNSSASNNRCASKAFGTPDLSIHNLRTGTIAPNGYFVQKSSFYANETIVVKFTVSNNGTKTSPQWYFQANLPSSDNPVYTSSAQPAIAPCSGRHYTIKVINPAKGSKEVFVNVDPHNLIKEANEVNNNARAFINIY